MLYLHMSMQYMQYIHMSMQGALILRQVSQASILKVHVNPFIITLYCYYIML